jgi:hypothetical protein
VDTVECAGRGPAAAKISREQFVTACARDILEPEDGYDAVKRPSVDTIFGLIDTRGRGALTLGELTTWFNAYGVCADDAERALRALDRDGDGDLSHDEVNDAVRAFYCATDSDTPANKLFGPF